MRRKTWVGVKAAFSYIMFRFYADSPCNKPIVFLQHQGHSRSVVGVKVVQQRPSHLVMFDPSLNRSELDVTQVRCIFIALRHFIPLRGVIPQSLC